MSKLLRSLGMLNPNEVGETQYAAIYEALDDATCDMGDEAEAIELIRGMCESFVEDAQSVLRRLPVPKGGDQ